MHDTDPSPLVEGITWAVSVLAVVISAIVIGIRKALKAEKAEKEKPSLGGELVMGAIMERQLVETLTQAILGLDGTARELLEHLREDAEEEQIERRITDEVQRQVQRAVRRAMHKEGIGRDDDD